MNGNVVIVYGWVRDLSWIDVRLMIGSGDDVGACDEAPALWFCLDESVL